MKNLKLRQLVSASAVLQRIAQLRMPASLSFKLSKIMKAINEEVETYESARLKCIETYSNGTNEQQEYTFPDDEARTKCIAEIEGLLDAEVSIDTYDVDLSALDIEISPIEISIIDFLFNIE